MNLWFFVWLLLSGSLLFFAGWTVYILYMQKKAWRDYAKKNKLRYSAGKFFASPEVNGAIDGYTIGVFSSEHVSEDVRGSRKMTAIEVGLPSRLPVKGAVGSGGMVALIENIQSYNEEVQPEHNGWDTGYVARSNSASALEEYLTPQRLDVLLKLMKMKNAWVIFIFEDRDTLLRIDTPDPLDKAEKIDRIIKRMIEVARVLDLDGNERDRLEKLAAEKRSKPKARAIDLADEALEEGINLELEEDESGGA